MRNFTVAYVPLGVGTFHMETAEDQFRKSTALIHSIREDAVVPEEKILSVGALAGYLDSFEDAGNLPDLIILQNLTFANAAYTYEVLRRFPDVPILLWTLRESAVSPGDGSRLRLNSLTGAFSAANAIASFRYADTAGYAPVQNSAQIAGTAGTCSAEKTYISGEINSFSFIYGAPEEEKVHRAIRNAVKAAYARYELKHLNIAAVGHTPEGFGFGRALDQEIMHVFGSRLVSIEARELIEKAKRYSEEETAPYLEKAQHVLVGLNNHPGIPRKNILDFARLYKAYSEYARDHKIGALASRCWPDFFTDFGTPVCAVLSLLNAEGTVASCESDTYGALSMYVCQSMTGNAAFFGDPVSLNEEDNSITFWHCGMAACSLAREDTGAAVGVHPNRKIGPTMEFGCRPCPQAVIFRIGRKPDGSFRFFIAEGEVEDRPRQYLGTSIVVKTKNNAAGIIDRAVREGWEPHYAIAYGDCADALSMLGNMLGVETERF